MSLVPSAGPNGLFGAIFGTGRSGSTWVGAVMDSHPEIAYRFEPFHRMRNDPCIGRALSVLRSEELNDESLGMVYRALLPAHPKISKPPFFKKSNRNNLGIRSAFLAARSLPCFAGTFARLYTPKPGAPVIFKEVTFEPIMCRILRQTSMRVVYLIRHPIGVCSSELRAQLAGKLPTGRQEVLTEILRDCRPDLLSEYGPYISRMPLLQRNAVLWRLDVEEGLRAAARTDRCLVVIYEALCMDSMRQFRTIFNHLGIPFHERVKGFLGSLEDIGSRKGMFSVFKNPAGTAMRWKTLVSPRDQALVMSVVQGSEAFAYGGRIWGAADARELRGRSQQ